MNVSDEFGAYSAPNSSEYFLHQTYFQIQGKCGPVEGNSETSEYVCGGEKLNHGAPTETDAYRDA